MMLLGRIVLGLMGLTMLAIAGVWARSEWLLRRRHDVPKPVFAAVPPAGADTLEGRRVAILVGCLEGCHGREGEGGTLKSPPLLRVTAPPLASVVPSYDDAELARLVRFGVKRDGRSAVGMPSSTFYPIGDDDLRRIVGVLRQRPPVESVPRESDVMPVGRLALALGRYRLSADDVDSSRPRWGELPRATPEERGRYWASVVCAECHGVDLAGVAFERSPALGAVVRGYGLEQFRHLLRTGEPISKRDLGIMSRVARRAFSHFRDDEVADLYAYLRTLPSTPPRPAP